jgi:hypothetical protein
MDKYVTMCYLEENTKNNLSLEESVILICFAESSQKLTSFRISQKSL